MDRSSAGSLLPALSEHWDGRAWTRVPSPDPAPSTILHGVAAPSATSAWAVGETNYGQRPVIEHWDGTAWRQVPSPVPAGTGSVLYGVAATSSGNAWAVGETDTSTGTVPNIRT